MQLQSIVSSITRPGVQVEQGETWGTLEGRRGRRREGEEGGGGGGGEGRGRGRRRDEEGGVEGGKKKKDVQRRK